MNPLEFVETFKNPGSEYRSVPFWSWNGRLEPDILRKQIRSFKRAGLGGFIMHARTGLATPYLSDDWFDCVRVCVEEAKTLGMLAILYDEDRYPSGSAGGMATAREEFRSNYLEAVEVEDLSLIPEGRIMAIFEARITAKLCATEVVRLETVPKHITPGKKLVLFIHRYAEPDTWHNNATYLDTMNPDAVAEFMRLTHENYYQNIGQEFGKTIPAIFTDEPRFGNISLTRRPWTPQLPNLFQERFHYDLCEHLMEVFYKVNGNDYSSAEYHYVELLTSLFVNGFAKQIGEWCEKHHIALTGHVFEEETPLSQSTVIGSAMRLYEYMQIPGVDQLCEDWYLIFEPLKQVSSVAHQFDRQWRITETGAATGWSFPFAGHKMLGDYQAVLGINMRSEHLTWYTMEGEAKRDFPLSLYQSPWFEDYKTVEDYFARINLVNSEGEECRELLVIHPVESVWLALGGNFPESDVIKNLDKAYIALSNTLLSNQLDYDYGDEDIISRHGMIKTLDGEVFLEIGQAKYKAVLIPPMLTIRKSTVDILRKFHAAGGIIVSSDQAQLPQFVDACPDSDIQTELKDMMPEETWLETLDKTIRRVKLEVVSDSAKFAAGVLYQLRKRDDGWSLMLCNTGYEKFPDMHSQALPLSELKTAYSKLKVSVKLDDAGEWFEFDPETGNIYKLNGKYADGKWHFETSLCELKSRLFMQFPHNAIEAKNYHEFQAVQEFELPADSCEYNLDSPNVVVLDHAKWRLSKDDDWEENDFVLNIDPQIRDRLELDECYNSKKPWANAQPWTIDWNGKISLPTVFLLLEFDCEIECPEECFFVLENIDSSTVTCNGVKLDRRVGCWVDESLQKLSIPSGILKKGQNQIEVAIIFDYRKNAFIEAMYLLGNFGVTARDYHSTLTKLPERLKIGDCVSQGFPNYSGNIIYSADFDYDGKSRIVCSIPKFGGVAVKVHANGNVVGMIWAPPYELELTDDLRNGLNSLEFEVLVSLMNSHGPFYITQEHVTWYDPVVMRIYDRPQRKLVVSGLLVPPILRIGKQ